MTCNACGTVYPNEDYPETGVLECPRMGQTFTYYQTPEELAHPEERDEHALKWLGDRPTMTSFSGHIRYRKVSWAWGQGLTLAKLYAVTGEIAYAERVAWILDRFARVFPNYLYHSYDGSVADWPPAEVAANMGEQEANDGPRGGRFPADAIRHAYGSRSWPLAWAGSLPACWRPSRAPACRKRGANIRCGTARSTSRPGAQRRCRWAPSGFPDGMLGFCAEARRQMIPRFILMATNTSGPCKPGTGRWMS